MRIGLIVLGVVLALLVAVRLALPGYLLRTMNARLTEISPLYSVQIEDLDLHLWRMAYTFQGVHGALKKGGFEFMTLPRVDVSLAWRELFRGRVVADVDARDAKLVLTTETIRAVSGYDPSRAKSEAKDVKEATIPFDLERLRAENASFEFSDVAGLPPEQKLRLTGIRVVANNLTPRDPAALTLATFNGAIQGTGQIKGVAQVRPKSEPPAWSVNLELRNFALRELNGVAARTVPLSFKSGELSLFTAARSVDGKLEGYVKPFLKDVVFIGDPKDFGGFTQFLYEIGGTIGNFFLKNRDTHALATKVRFRTVNGKVETDTAKAIATAVENASGPGLTENLDETLEIQ